MIARPDFKILENLDRDTYVVDINNSIYSNDSRNKAILKYFRFKESSDWYGIQSVSLEVERLKKLRHSSILSYLDVIPTEDGFCVLREYVEGNPLSPDLDLSTDTIYSIASKLLEIFKYLHELDAPIFHANVKPNNIIVDADYNVYLTDFFFDYKSFTRKELVSQRYCFASPEYWQGKSLLPSSDLYSVGILLICLFAKIPVSDIPNLYDGDRLSFEFANIQINDWLHQLVKPNPRYRFASANEALQSLLNISYLKIESLPNVFIRLGKRTYQLSCESPPPIKLTACSYGDLVTDSFVISNSRDHLELSGEWSISPEDRSWISIDPSSFKGNETRFRLQVDTQNLYENSIYYRQIELLTNGEVSCINLDIKVDTAKFFTKPKKWLSVASIGLIFLAAFWFSVVEHNVLLTIAISVPFMPLLYFEFFTYTTAVASATIWGLGFFFSTAFGLGQEIGFPLSATASFILLMAISVDLVRKSISANIPFHFPFFAAVTSIFTGLGLGLIFRDLWGGWIIFLFSLLALFGIILFPDWQRFQKRQEYRRRLPFLVSP